MRGEFQGRTAHGFPAIRTKNCYIYTLISFLGLCHNLLVTSSQFFCVTSHKSGSFRMEMDDDLFQQLSFLEGYGRLPMLNQKEPTKSLLNAAFYMQFIKNVGLKVSQNGSNFLFSPLSIHVILGMVAAGSSGRTLEQILYFLKLENTHVLNSVTTELIHLISVDGTQKGGPCLAFINGMWIEKSFSLKPSFKETMNAIYRAEAKAADFQTKANEVRKEVNSWVASVTNGLIQEVLPYGSLDSSTMFVLANALHFKGAWNKKFDPTKTQNRKFYLLDGGTVHVPFMTNSENQCVGSFDGFKVLKLPYLQVQDQRQFSMYFFLPDEIDGLPSLIEKLSSDSKLLTEPVYLHKVEVGEFWLPKFKISFAMETSPILKAMGLVLPFSDVGDFTEMVDSRDNLHLHVSEIFHKSFVEVNEDGTDAAAATALMGVGCCLDPPEPIDFVADHPFMFMIREDVKGVVLFVGNVIDPSKSE